MPTPRADPATLDGGRHDGWSADVHGAGTHAPADVEPRLRLLYHCDLARLGAVSLRETLPPDTWVTVGRGAPAFALVGRHGPSDPLDDPQVSREQVRIRWVRDADLFEVEPIASAKRSLVRVDLDARGPTGPLVTPITGRASLPVGACIAIGDRVMFGLERGSTRSPRDDRMGLVGEGDVMWSVRDEVRSVAQFGRPALVTGPTGAGKELVARALHLYGPRPAGPFVPVNCAALPHNLVESALFGHKKGAFTGADTEERGLFRAADGGTLFLDELGELPLPVQPKLLRILQDGVVVPVGAHDGRRIDVRVVAATHRSLDRLVRDGELREDLFHRISAHVIRVPPLAERRFDVPELFVHVLRRLRAEHPSLEWLWSSGEQWRPAVPIGFIASLVARPFDGNVRELENIVERTARLNLEPGTFRAPELGASPASRAPAAPAPASLPRLSVGEARIDPRIVDAGARAAGEALGLARKTVVKLLSPQVLAVVATEDATRDTRATTLRALAADALIAILDAHDYNQSGVAEVLGTSRTTLIKLMDDLGVARATDLTLEQINAARAEGGEDLERVARLLRVSSGALKRRLAALSPRART